ncbi:MAG: efflux RND transporter periplasmic adaptor subunit [Luteolibacter sp.]|jgi:Cu(I)/Ag(I) efflux system membrane fusion protein|nr:efflux RND transporter periplasmic adaptor subunit [Luteolibacter sp.]
MKTFLTILITALLAASGTWFALRKLNPDPAGSAATAERKPLFYQSAMHPWIKSDKPGRCTICGMELTPVYEGEKGFDESGGGNVVALTQNQIQVLHVQTAEAKTRPLVRTLRVSGSIDDNDMRHRVLSAYVDGRIDKLHVNYLGAEVTEGQPLAEFYSPSLLQAEREYRQLGGELRKNTALRLRQMGLAQAQIDALDQKPADSLTSQILTPITGTVVAKSVYEGQYVSTGQQLFEIADFSTMWFMFRAYEQDMPWIKPGLTVRVTTPSIPDKTFTGKVTFIDPNFDEATRSTKVRVELDNPLVNGRRELLHRLYAEGAVELEAPAVLTVPRSAVIETGAEAVVYIDQDGGAYAHTVIKTGRRGDTHVEVLSGIKEGDSVVTNGNLLIDGQAEMNRAFMSPPETVMPVTAQTGLNEEQKKAIAEFLKVADAMAAALAADDLTKFNTASEPAMKVTGAMVKLLRPNIENPDDLDKARHFHGFEDLKAARAAFQKFAVAATALLEPLRKAGQTPDFQIYECGMVDEAVPDVPKKARWIQTGGRAMANPFFGAEMPECGKEIKP